ncbi:MAG TPA: MBL fold metallo-hydrolase [Pseudonocardiaceae bacterium]|jgi:cyclase|nr:MBL fold metallo-hydrolase [Pseudonocardiaceae bacterium]
MSDHQTEYSTENQQGTLRAVVDGVFAWVQPDGTWWVNNAGAVAGRDDVVLIDTCATEARTRRLLDAVAAATDGLPIRLAVNTHLHGDHTHGNSLLPDAVPIIAHEATREGLIADQIIDGCPPFWEPLPDWGNVSRRLPTVTTREDLTVYAGERRIELRHPGYTAHTPGDLVAWLPEERVLFSGDLLFHQGTPLVFMGSVEGARRCLDWIADFQPDFVVPGHGPLIDAATLPTVLATHDRYYQLVTAAARDGLADGIDPLDAARRCELGELGLLPDAERLVLNLHRAYTEADGREFDIVSALADALAFNGGPMHTRV